jgi:molecular chaperone GrpE
MRCVTGSDTARSELDEMQDKYVRLYAEFENARKLWEKQRSEYLQFSSFRILREFATILDDIDAALLTLKPEEHKEYVEGLNMVYGKLRNVLLKEGLKTVEAQGVKFDPNFHEAVMFEDRDDIDEHMVTAVVQQGYMYGDKLIRPAKVKVSRKPQGS